VWAAAVPGRASHLGQGRCWLYGLLPGSSAVEVASAPPAVRLGPELALQLRQAPDLGPVGAEAGLNVGGRLANRGQVDGEQLRAPLQRRRDRPAHVRVMPGPHRDSLSNAFEGGSGNPAYRDSRCQPAWSRWGTLGAILPAFCPTALHRAAQPRITLNAQVTWILTDQRERDCGEPSRTEPNESHPAENRKVGGSIPSLPTGHIDTVEDRVASGPGLGRPPLRPTQAEGNAPRRRCHPREAAWQTIRT